MKLAYADPPYPGQAKKWYGSHPDYAGEVDHVELIERLIFKIARLEDRQYVPDTLRIPQGLAPEIPGQKPKFFVRWVFRLIGAEPDDTLADLFPGSGVVAREWEFFTRQTVLAL